MPRYHARPRCGYASVHELFYELRRCRNEPMDGRPIRPE